MPPGRALRASRRSCYCPSASRRRREQSLVAAATAKAFGPLSGAHLNPVVSFVMALRHRIGWPDAALHTPAQAVGAVLGAMLAHAMFEGSRLQVATPAPRRYGATAIRGCGHGRAYGLPCCWRVVPLRRSGSTSRQPTGSPPLPHLQNPAVTLARSLTDTFAGIVPIDVPGFMAAQVAGGILVATCACPLRDRAAVT